MNIIFHTLKPVKKPDGRVASGFVVLSEQINE